MRGTGRAHSLDDQVEGGIVGVGEAIVVHGHAQAIVRARALALKYERGLTSRQVERCRPSAIDDPHHRGHTPAAGEVLLDGVAERAVAPQPAEGALEVGETVQDDGGVESASQSPADEGGDAAGRLCNGVLQAGAFREENSGGRVFGPQTPLLARITYHKPLLCVICCERARKG